MSVDPMVDTQDRIPDLRDQVEVVRHHQDGHALLQLREGLDKLFFHRKINVRRRLVEEEQLRFAGQCPRDEDPPSMENHDNWPPWPGCS